MGFAHRPDGHPLPANPGVPRVDEPSHALFGITEIEGGFPHSEIPGSKPVRGSPGLIAAYHVLHRLSAPRHPPNALKTLDRSHRQRARSEDRGRKTEDRRRTNPFSVLRRPFSDVRPALDFSKRPVLLQTHPGALAVKLGSRLDSNG